MKNMFDSPESFQAYATIEAGIWMMSEIQKEWNKKRSPIEKAIDDVTRFGRDQDIMWSEKVVSVIEDIIVAKKFIGMDFDADQNLLDRTKEHIKLIKPV